MAEKRITVRVTEDIHRQVKAKAALEGKSVSDLLRAFLVSWLKSGDEEDTEPGEIRRAMAAW